MSYLTVALSLSLTHTQLFYGSVDFVRDNLGEPVPEETFTHSHLSWSSIVRYLLHPSTTIHGILPVQSTHLTVFFPQSLSKFSLHTYIHTYIYIHLFGVLLCLAPSTSYSQLCVICLCLGSALLSSSVQLLTAYQKQQVRTFSHRRVLIHVCKSCYFSSMVKVCYHQFPCWLPIHATRLANSNK